MANKKILFLLILALFLMPFSGCGPKENGTTTAPTSVPPGTTAPQKEDPTQTTVSTEPTTEPIAPNSPVSAINIDFLRQNRLSVQQILACSDDTILFFVNPTNGDGTISESTIIYSYSFELNGFRPKSFFAGIINLYSDYVFDDGTISIVTLNSETYEFDKLLFLNPVTLEAEEAPLPDMDFYDMHISPNKKYAAYTTYDYMQVSSFQDSASIFTMEKREVPVNNINNENIFDDFVFSSSGEEEPTEPDFENMLDEEIPAATGWAKDSSMLFYYKTGWINSYNPGYYVPETNDLVEVSGLEDAILSYIDSENIFFQNRYSCSPLGIYNTQSQTISAIDYIPQDLFITKALISPNGRYLCILTSITEVEEGEKYTCSAFVYDILSKEIVNSFTLSRPGETISFEQACFSPSSDRLCLLTSRGYANVRLVYTFDFLE